MKLGSALVVLVGTALAAPATSNAAGKKRKAFPQVVARKRGNAKVKFNIGSLPLNAQHALVRGGANPRAQAWAVALLRRFAEGKRSPLAKRLKTKRHRNAAARIVARIDALPKRARDAAFAGQPTTGKPKKPPAGKSGYGPGQAQVGLGVATDTLPAEAIALPDAYTMQMTGVRRNSGTSAGEQFVAVGGYIAVNSWGMQHQIASVPDTGLLSLSDGGIHANTGELYVGKYRGVVVSGVFLSGGGAAARKAEFETMLGLAETMAKQSGGKLPDVAYAIDQTANILALSAPDDWPLGAVVKTIVGDAFVPDPLSLHGLYATKKTEAGPVDFKLTHPHQIGTASYDVFFTVPDPEPRMATVVVTVKKIEVLSGVDPGPEGDDLRLGVGIGAGSFAFTSKDLAPNTDVHNNVWIVRRPMSSDEVPIQISLRDLDPPPSEGSVGGLSSIVPKTIPCGTAFYGPCPSSTTAIDVGPRKTWKGGGLMQPAKKEVAGTLNFKLRVSTGALSGGLVGELGDTLTATGNMRNPRARLTVKVDVER